MLGLALGCYNGIRRSGAEPSNSQVIGCEDHPEMTYTVSGVALNTAQSIQSRVIQLILGLFPISELLEVASAGFFTGPMSQQVWVYYGSGTVDSLLQPAAAITSHHETAARAPGRHFLCSCQMVALFCVKL